MEREKGPESGLLNDGSIQILRIHHIECLFLTDRGIFTRGTRVWSRPGRSEKFPPLRPDTNREM